MSTRQIREHCKLNQDCLTLLRNSIHEMGLSARAHDKILRVARTIADMEDTETVEYEHLSEAINYRLLDRKLLT
jgi:magnesium chelatase family protein